MLLPVSQAGCSELTQVEDVDEIPATIEVVNQEDQKKADLSEAGKKEATKPEQQDLITLQKKEEEEFAKQTIEIPKSWKRLDKESHIWADKDKRQVIVRGAICIQGGLLEMFACPRNTKEHESIVSVHAQAYQVHSTLLALKIQPGKPMQWNEDYTPVAGPVIDIEVRWTDENGKLVTCRAQELILNTDTEKPMTADFVFGGSVLIHDEENDKDSYMADYGPFINVANQPDAMIDVSIQSSQEAQGSLFAANPKKVPPINTKVYLVLSDSGRKVNVERAKSAAQKDSQQE
jgi:hypothetical protein